jgi:hydroxymethylbilane synthase
MASLRLGTRGSALARRQTEMVCDALRIAHAAIEIVTVEVRTEGDRRQDVPLEEMGGLGVFVKEIEQRMLAGEIDIAVHSLKDMPSELPDGLTLGALLPRGDVRDVLVGRDGAGLAALKPTARIGSDSRRRAVQLLALRPDVRVVSIRGNVDSRLRKVDTGEYDAVALALAGLERLGLGSRATQVFSEREVLPAAGQGAIAVECRSDDHATLSLLSAIDHGPTRAATDAERAFLSAMGAGCRLPIAAYATLEGDEGDLLHLEAMIADDEGRMHRGAASGNVREALQIGAGLAGRLRQAAHA